MCVRMHNRWQIRNNLRLPEGPRRVRAGKRKERATAANRLSPTGPPTDQNIHFCKQEEENWAKSETNYSWRPTNLDGYASR